MLCSVSPRVDPDLGIINILFEKLAPQLGG